MIQRYAINMRFDEETLHSLPLKQPNTRKEQAHHFENILMESPDVFAILLQARQIREEKNDKAQASQYNKVVSNNCAEVLNVQSRLLKMASNIRITSQ